MLHVTQSESPTCLCRELGWYRDDPRPFWDEVFLLQILQKRFARMCGENNKKIGEMKHEYGNNQNRMSG